MASSPFERLIRFETPDGEIKYGDLGKAVPTKEIEGREVDVLEGDVKSGFKKGGGRAKVGKLLSPIPESPIILCVGLNYRKHAEECNLQIPTNPAIFTKPTTALTHPTSPIPIHPTCTTQLDYEGELTLIISRDCKNVPASSYRSVLLGYTISNDVSARNFQMPMSVSGGQFGYAKSFDGFAPLGPCVVAPEVVEKELGGVQGLRIKTSVNGEVRQDGGCDDMIFGVGEVVEHLSRGTTLK
ncbi:fumarylacetoacetate hydrolase family protein [Pyrenophora tritici-repentis]|nr:fumarylacetoacetate hydrolase family protein [Pyrenophora tritici-repentis]PWO27002.1 CHCH domain containing protein [Pyrenophora tritici-repentis]